MTRMITCLLLGSACASVWAAGSAPAARPQERRVTGSQWTIVATYQIPEGASGLAFDGSDLYCGIYGSNGSEVYRIDRDTGAYVLEFIGPQEDAYGLTFDGTYLWTTDHPGSSSTPAVAMQLDWNGGLLDQVDLPAHYVSGIAYDAGDFWIAQYYPDPAQLYQVNGAGDVLEQFGAPDNQPWDLCIVDDAIWMADYWGDALYKIDRASGALLESHPSQGVDPAGVVWDGAFLWYCDNGSNFGQDALYKIDLAGGGTPAISIPVADHNFGNTTIGTMNTWNMAISNTGDADLVIAGVSFAPPGALATTAVFPMTLPAGQGDTLPVVYSPGGFGALSAVATVASNDPVTRDAEVSLSGSAVYAGPHIAVTAAAHNYGAVRLNATTRWFLEVQNQGDSALTLTAAPIDDAHFYLDAGVTLPLALDTLETANLGVWFSPDAAAGFAGTLTVASSDPGQSNLNVALSGSGVDADYPLGTSLWSYTVTGGFDNSPKAIVWIPDVSGDGAADVVVASEDDFVRCLNGNSHGIADVLWAHEIPAGSVYSQNGLQIREDIDGDEVPDVIVGAAWGGRLIRALSGKTGSTLWTHDTDEYGDGGWVYQVDSSQDYNGDDLPDVLASTGDDANDTGPKRVYCLDALSGTSIWERPVGGPVFGVIGVADFTGDGVPDAVAGAANGDETQGRIYGIDGADGTLEWTYIPGSATSVWGLAQIHDINSDGIPDIAAVDFSGTIHGLDAVSGGAEYALNGFGTSTRLELLDDVTGDGHPEAVPAHFSTFAGAVDTRTGHLVWSTPLADKPASVARIPDINGDGLNDVAVGTLFNNNLVYFLDGVSGAILDSLNYGTPVDAIGVLPDVVGDGSWEAIAGGRNGLVTCLSGGLDAAGNPADLNDDRVVNAADLALLLGAWGPNPGNPADLNGDGVVNAADLAILLGAWSA